jgi:CelD/BcsL family acetyltransferase involved in cellulose biosynthesis
VLADASVRGFHGAAGPKLVQAGVARIHRMTIDGTVVGIYYGMAHAGRSYAYLGGFDPAFERESPGTILIGHAILEASREGGTEFHFLRGGEAYKYQWGAVERWNRRRVITRRLRHARAS